MLVGQPAFEARERCLEQFARRRQIAEPIERAGQIAARFLQIGIVGCQRARANFDELLFESSCALQVAEVRERGREVMNAFQEGYPDMRIFLTFGYSLPWNESQQGKRPLAECHYGLLAPFLDGMLDVANGKTILVDGNEGAYRFRDTNRFAASYRAMKQELLPIIGADKNAYAKHFSLGFGLWMDCDWRKVGWDTNDFSKNFYMPEAFENSVHVGLQTADDYVWVYSEQPRWWSKEGKMLKLPAAYDEAVRRARKGVARE
jgi:hypothetical protein